MAKFKLHEKMRQAMLKLLNVNSLRFFGLLVYNFEYVEIKDHAKFRTMYVAYDVDKNNWTIGYDVDFVEQSNPGELVYIIAHEILHAINGHCFRSIDRIEDYWGLATDHVINICLDKDIDCAGLQMIKPESRFLIPKLRDNHFNWSVEKVYAWLQKNAKVKPATDGNGNKIEGLNMVYIKGGGERGKDLDLRVQADMELTIKSKPADVAQKNLIGQARAHLNSVCTNRGLVSGSLYGLLKHLVEVEIPPEEIIETAIKNILVLSDERSWRSINKRLYPHGIMSCANETKEILGDVICLVDHSGSISDRDCALFGGAIKNCCTLFQNLHILYHDTKQQGDAVVLSSNDVLRSKKLFEVRGRGGTAHDDAFDYVQQCYDEGISVSLVLIFTDWDSNIKHIWSRYNWHQELPIINILPEKVRDIDRKYGKTCTLQSKNK